MNEPTGEKPSVKGSSFQLDKDPDKITSDQIKFYLNDGFMRGKVPAEEFVDRIIDTAKRNDRVAVAALQVYAISLGNLTHSSMMVDGYTRSILSQGIENEFTQSIIRAISPEHIKILRELYITGNNDAGNALLLSLRHAPRVADQEDMKILCKEFEGEPPSSIFPTRQGSAIYYPKKILDVMVTTREVIQKRSDLVNGVVIKAIDELPKRIETGSYAERPSYDRGISMDKLIKAARDLREIL